MDINAILDAADLHSQIKDPDVAHLVINHDEVVNSNLIPGLNVETKQIDDGVDVKIVMDEGVVITKPVHMCFGMTPDTGVQRIVLDVEVQPQARLPVLAHCVFPNAVDIQHLMDAEIHVGAGAEYIYQERHIHSPEGGLKVVPNAEVHLDEGARLQTDFELVQGRVGLLDIDYETTCEADSVMEMTAKVNGSGDDRIKISETGHLIGEGAVGVLNTRIAVRDSAEADIYNKLTATAPRARGHVDCREIIQDNGVARAVPIVEVRHPQAHVTHEAAIGSVDSKQLQTLLSRGLSEDEAEDLIIQG
ncbi:MAG: SufD family Fe-S cluster assembly protein, partial [Armatimonadota bacterium]